MKIRIKPFQRMMTLLLTILGLLISSQDLGSEDGGSGGPTCPYVCTVNWTCKDSSIPLDADGAKAFCDRTVTKVFFIPDPPYVIILSNVVCYRDRFDNYCLGSGASHEGRDHYCQGNWGCQGSGCSCKNGFCICN